ncbi:porphobilinogen synthase [Deinobacterium chartae]|uniref:Delta-aminolevulinic acid dehydratase n=1 Tax=Deinobacterium chartae TaxID=521158 RepID=A0A841HZ26_9DEIO|nr:porphobilinogen synthase [Deinobacterium chartae]MBB6097152.1 porphobilinogen synthase [Deinobacterium chartae]
MNLIERPRRLRRTAGLRAMVRETFLQPSQLIYPMFVLEGEGRREPISAMPGIHRFSIDLALEEGHRASELGIRALALFPALESELKNPQGSESWNDEGLFQRAIRAFKRELPEMMLVTDVALDPYSSEGHDGLVTDSGEILNDETVELLVRMSLSQARAGADVIAPSDMMDGRVGAIRAALDAEGFTQVAIMAYSTKYASGYYGPFRTALDSAPRRGDKATYQMDPAGGYREALRESRLDVEQGADFLMVKPALAYLDVLRMMRDSFDLPLVAYNVSGEYAMVKAAASLGYIDERRIVLETLTGMRRAGADAILTYHALDAARWLREG